MVSTIMFMLTGLLVGAALGFVMQRGRFCMNSAYREVLFQDYTMLRAYVVAVVITIIGANLIEDLGWLRHADEAGDMVVGTLYRQGFAAFCIKWVKGTWPIFLPCSGSFLELLLQSSGS